MKSQVNASPQRSRFVLEVLKAVLADQRHPRLGERAHLLQRARTSSRRGSPPRAPRARAPARGCAGSAGLQPVNPGIDSPPHETRLAPRAAAVAPVGEEELGMAARAQLADLDLRSTPACSSSRRATARRSSIARSARPSPERPKAVEHLVADLVAAGADAGPIAAAVALDLLHPALDDPGRQPPPAAVDHRHAPAPPARPGGSRRRRRAGVSPATVGHVAVGLREASERGRRTRAGSVGSSWRCTRSRHAPAGPIRTPRRVDLERGRQPVAVLAHPGVAGEAPEVERLEGRLADPAEPGAERGPRAGELGLEPAHPVLLPPVHHHAAEANVFATGGGIAWYSRVGIGPGVRSRARARSPPRPPRSRPR